MAGENCVISIPTFGKVRVKATHLIHGVNMFGIGGGEEQSRTRKFFFTTHKTSGGFYLGVVFTSHAQHERFMEWLERYARWIADPYSPGAPARVVIPSRNFDKTAILEAGIEYGDEAGQFVYRSELRFMGSRDPVDLSTTSTILSTFEAARDRTLVRLYPSGSGQATLKSWNAVGTVKDGDFGGSGRVVRPI